MEEYTNNAAAKLLTRRSTDKYERVSTDSLSYDNHNRLIRKERITHRQERDIKTYRNNLPQSEEMWREGKLHSTVRYHYIPFKKGSVKLSDLPSIYFSNLIHFENNGSDDLH